MRSVVAKESHDLVSECNSFQRRTDADHVLLVFNASAQEAAYLGHGYFLPEQVGEPPSGINSYPVIFATPTVSFVKSVLHCLFSNLYKTSNSGPNVYWWAGFDLIVRFTCVFFCVIGRSRD